MARRTILFLAVSIALVGQISFPIEGLGKYMLGEHYDSVRSKSLHGTTVSNNGRIIIMDVEPISGETHFKITYHAPSMIVIGISFELECDSYEAYLSAVNAWATQVCYKEPNTPPTQLGDVYQTVWWWDNKSTLDIFYNPKKGMAIWHLGVR